MSITIIVFGHVISFGTWGAITKDTPEDYDSEEDDDEDPPKGLRDKGADDDGTPADVLLCPAYYDEAW